MKTKAKIAMAIKTKTVYVKRLSLDRLAALTTKGYKVIYVQD